MSSRLSFYLATGFTGMFLLFCGSLHASQSAKAESRKEKTENRNGQVEDKVGDKVSHGTAPDAPRLIVVVGTPGDETFATNFLHQAQLWKEAAAQTDAEHLAIGVDDSTKVTDREQFQEILNSESKDNNALLWLVLIGHGTFDGKEARFNLRGPDVSATELAQWLEPFERPMVIINTSSASAPFLKPLSATNRIIVTATRSGNELNFARLGQFLAKTINDPAADLDKDEQVSVLEAFLTASRQVARFYKQEGRLITEHALIDDNGDGLGTSADWYRGLRATKKPKGDAAVDGFRARQVQLVPGAADRAMTPEQRAERDGLERAVLEFREQKEQLPGEDYYTRLETLLLKLARFYESVPGPTVPVE